MSMMEDEKTCITQVLSGDAGAYRYLVERYQTGLIIYCENIVKDRHDAEDVAQEAFMKAYLELIKFSNRKGRYSTWLYRIATNLCIDLLRKNKRNVTVDDVERYMALHAPPHITKEEIDDIREAVELLDPPKYACVVRGYFWEGKSYQALADEYHTTTGTIGTWLSRAKVQLKEKLS